MIELETLHITAADITDGVYTGSADVTRWMGHIEIAADLGEVRFFATVTARGRIRALAGSGIKAGLGIKAGESIEAGWGIKAGLGIEAGEGIEAGWGIKAGEGIEAGWGIEAGSGIEAGLGIEAGESIKAGLGIEAGEGIEAGWGIEAKTVSVRLRIFVGLCMWRLPEPHETQVRADITSGTLAHGEHVPPAKNEAADAAE